MTECLPAGAAGMCEMRPGAGALVPITSFPQPRSSPRCTARSGAPRLPGQPRRPLVRPDRGPCPVRGPAFAPSCRSPPARGPAAEFRVRSRPTRINIDGDISGCTDDMFKLKQSVSLSSVSPPKEHHRVGFGCRREVVCLNESAVQLRPVRRAVGTTAQCRPCQVYVA